MIGTIVHEQYQIQELLGEGGMGVVYKALDLELDRLVALKFLKAELGDNQALIKRFRDELKVLAAFNHPNIALLYTSFNWQNRPVMVMEMVEGEPLNQMIGRCGPIPAHRCVPIVLQALAGVGEAHRRGIVHRDLKPANLMLNQMNAVKVMDFGIAKIESSPGLTRTTATMGTPFYMAPEQIDPERFGLARVDARADIYAMGVTLYELLAGEVPFKGATEFSIHRAHLEQVPQPPTLYYPHIPAPVVEAVLHAMAKDPKDRFQSAEQFADALRRTPLADPAAIQPQLHISQPGIAQPPAPPFTPVPHSASTASEASRTPSGASQFGGGIAAAAGPTHSTETPVIARPSQPRKNGLLIALFAMVALLLIAGAGFGLYELLKPSPELSQSAHLSGGGGGSGGGESSPPSAPPHSSGGDFKLPEPKPDPPSAKKGEDIQLPFPDTPPKQPALASARKLPSTTIPSASAIIAGQWSGYYMSCEDNTKTTAAMRLKESAADGTNSLVVSGRLTLSGAQGVQSCAVNNGAFLKSRNRLTFSVSSCNSGAAPAYLSVSHTTVLSLNGNQLDGVVAPDSPCTIVAFHKM